MRRRVALAAALAMSLTLGSGIGWTQTGDPALQDLRKDIDSIKKDLQEIKTLLRARPSGDAPPDDSPKNLVLTLEKMAIKGEKSAKLVLVDFTDYQ